ncbi:MAG: RluA family pseudouridine synthase [Minisyncoccales bacterium]
MIYEDDDLLVFDKPAGINSDDFEKRIHRLDKDTSGILLVAKSSKALDFFQKQFKNRTVIKKYLALVCGDTIPEADKIETLMGRSLKDRKKQKTYLFNEPDSQRKGLRKAITNYKVIKKIKGYTLIEVEPKTGRKHQIRCHLAALGYPIAGDKLYGFKNQACPKGLKRQFLHASSIKIKMPDGETKEFRSKMPDELRQILENIK